MPESRLFGGTYRQLSADENKVAPVRRIEGVDKVFEDLVGLVDSCDLACLLGNRLVG